MSNPPPNQQPPPNMRPPPPGGYPYRPPPPGMGGPPGQMPPGGYAPMRPGQMPPNSGNMPPNTMQNIPPQNRVPSPHSGQIPIQNQNFPQNQNPNMNQGPPRTMGGPPPNGIPYQNRPPPQNQPPPMQNQQPPIQNRSPPIQNQPPPMQNQLPPMQNQSPIQNQVPQKSTQLPPPQNQQFQPQPQQQQQFQQQQPQQPRQPQFQQQQQPQQVQQLQQPRTLQPPQQPQQQNQQNQVDKLALEQLSLEGGGHVQSSPPDSPQTIQNQPPTHHNPKRRLYAPEIATAYQQSSNQSPMTAPNQMNRPDSNQFQGGQQQFQQPQFQQPQYQQQPTQQPYQQSQPLPNSQMMSNSLAPTGFNLMGQIDLNDIDWTPIPSLPEDIKANRGPFSNCSPIWKGCTLNVFPQNQALLSKTKLPLGLIITPFRIPSDRDPQMPVINPSTISRCKRCRTYINPFVTLTEGRWKCNMCFSLNEVPSDFDFDPATQQRIDRYQRPELTHGLVEFIAPAEYMVRPPQPPVYLFIIDVSGPAIANGMLATAVKVLKDSLDNIPNLDRRTKIGIITVDSSVHFYNLNSSLSKPQMLVVTDLEDIFLPSPDDLLANLFECRAVIDTLLSNITDMFKNTANPTNVLGSALQAAQKLMNSIGGKIIIFQSTLPNAGPGVLTKREEPSALGTPKENALLQPSNAFYKNFSIEFSRCQIGVDIFLFANQYMDVVTLDCLAHFTGGSLFYYPDFNAARTEDAFKFASDLSRHLSHPFGLEAVLRVRASKGIRITSYHGNFFTRSTDLLALPNVNPDNSYTMQMAIEENLTTNIVCFQTALLYTTSFGERRIRVLNLALPVSTDISSIFRGASGPAIANLLSKMAIERALTAKLEDARDALINKIIEVLQVYRGLFSSNSPAGPLIISDSLKILPLMILSLTKHKSLRDGNQVGTDIRSAAMALVRTSPLDYSNLFIIPKLYALHTMQELHGFPGTDGIVFPPVRRLSSESLERHGAFLLDNGHELYLWLGMACPVGFIQQVFNVHGYENLHSGKITLPVLENTLSTQINNIIGKIREMRFNEPYLYLVKEDSDPLLRYNFFSQLIEDRTGQAMSYSQFIPFIKEKSSS